MADETDGKEWLLGIVSEDQFTVNMQWFFGTKIQARDQAKRLEEATGTCVVLVKAERVK